MGRPAHSNEGESPHGQDAGEPARPDVTASVDPTAAGAIPEGLCGDFNMRIARDGTWFYQGSPIGRIALVKLFATVLHRKADGSFWLTTPVESGTIAVEDAPFIAVAMTVTGQGRDRLITFRTNLDDEVPLDVTHPLRVTDSAEGPKPYVMVRKGLEARLARPVFYELVELGEADPVAPDTLGVWSCGQFFALGSLT